MCPPEPVYAGPFHYFHQSVYDALPKSVDLRSEMPPVFAQGWLGSCTGQAVGGLLDYYLRNTEAHRWRASRMCLWWYGKIASGKKPEDNDGASIEDVLGVVKTGVCREHLFWRYPVFNNDVHNQTCLENCSTVGRQGKEWTQKPPTQEAEKNRGNITVTQFDDLDVTGENCGLVHIKAALAQGQPVVIGLLIDGLAFAMTGSDGEIIVVSPKDKNLSGHAMLAVGYIEGSDTLTSDSLILRNSYGADWGAQGYGYLPYEYLGLKLPKGAQTLRRAVTLKKSDIQENEVVN